ncbi:MAG: MBL fold metallo-hydrolase [Bacilli bacterium]|nr:MBL fold metallo-hydrolase [Bacilli bacterium]
MKDVHLIVNGMVQGNCWIVGENQECYIIDPGDEANKIISWVERHYTKVKAILLTHGHFDHCGAVDEVAEAFKCPVYIDFQDLVYIGTPTKKASEALFGVDLVLKTPLKSLADFKDDNITVLKTPGHTPGSVTFLFKDIKAAFTGDCLFKYSIGRTDLPGGDYNEMLASLKFLASLPDDYMIYPGHEPAGSMKEIAYGLNPYISAYHKHH